MSGVNAWLASIFLHLRPRYFRLFTVLVSLKNNSRTGGYRIEILPASKYA